MKNNFFFKSTFLNMEIQHVHHTTSTCSKCRGIQFTPYSQRECTSLITEHADRHFHAPVVDGNLITQRNSSVHVMQMSASSGPFRPTRSRRISYPIHTSFKSLPKNTTAGMAGLFFNRRQSRQGRHSQLISCWRNNVRLISTGIDRHSVVTHFLTHRVVRS